MGNDNSNEKEKSSNDNGIITNILENNNNNNNKNKKEEKVITFINTNNTCYANSILQALLSLKIFKEKILSYLNNNNIHKYSTLKSLSELFNIIENKKKSDILNINDFINIIKNNNQEFNNDEHHDAHEFLTWLLDDIEQNINSIQKKNKKNNNKINNNTTNNNNNNNDNFIRDLFSGQQSSITKCLNCENTSEVFETFYNLSLDIETNSSLIYCLKNYFGTEILRSKDKFFCEKCNSLQEAEKKVNLIKLPKILIIQLKRFKMKNYSNLIKLLGYVSIPKKFNANYLLKTKEEKEYNYKLKNMVIHLGQRGEYGHYFTLVNQENNKWINYNDEKSTYLNENDISKFFGNVDENNINFYSTTYLLFYELI